MIVCLVIVPKPYFIKTHEFVHPGMSSYSEEKGWCIGIVYPFTDDHNRQERHEGWVCKGFTFGKTIVTTLS